MNLKIFEKEEEIVLNLKYVRLESNNKLRKRKEEEFLILKRNLKKNKTIKFNNR